MNFKIEAKRDLFKYNESEIREIKKQKYIFPTETAEIVRNKVDENISAIFLELLDIGKMVYFNEKNIEEATLKFVNEHGLFNFMASFAEDEFFFFANHLALKQNDMLRKYLVKTDAIGYIRIFMPELLNQEVADKIDEIKSHMRDSAVTEEVKILINNNFIYSRDYGEPLEMMTTYAKELFEDLLQIQNEEDGEFNIREFDARFEVGNDNELKLRYENLKNAMDITFFSEVNAEIRKLKICKYCNKPFIAENPKAEYDKHSCKNRANVYKFRSRQK